MEFINYDSKYDDELISLFYNTIEHISSGNYTKEELRAWSETSETIDKEGWHRRFENSEMIIAINDNGKIIGFGNLVDNYYIDLLFVHHEYQKKQLGTKILKRLELIARGHKSKKLEADVSIPARPLFEKRGFEVIEAQSQMRDDIEIINYKMEKQL